MSSTNSRRTSKRTVYNPLVVQEIGGQLILIDGRNRREACRRAGIVPSHVMLNGQDPVAWIVGANVNRRNISKGQMALALAKIFPEPEERGRGKKGKLSLHFSKMYLSRARTVLAHAPKLVDQVLTSGLPLNEAYETAKTRKAQEELFAGQLAKLREQAPDLAAEIMLAKHEAAVPQVAGGHARGQAMRLFPRFCRLGRGFGRNELIV